MTEKPKKFFSVTVGIEKAKGWQEFMTQAESDEQVRKSWTYPGGEGCYFIDEGIEVVELSKEITVTEITEDEYKARLRYL